ncbi:hypothetical protein GCM10027605_19670 [Micromonospora zhanjiangensis]
MPPGSDRPGLTPPGRGAPAIPEPSARAPADRPAAGRPARPGAPWKECPMATRTKQDKTTDEAREQARRALQTSMDTRQ